MDNLLKTFIATAVLCLGITSSHASQINQVMKDKAAIGGLNLDQMLLNNGNDVLVVYNSPVSNKHKDKFTSDDLMNEAKKIKDIKSKVGLKAGSKMVHLRDYLYTPVTFTRFYDNQSLLDALNDPNVAYIMPNEINTVNLESSLPFIGQSHAIESNYSGKGTIVAVLDTGVDYTRSAFGNCATLGSQDCKVLASVDMTPTDDGQKDDARLHGTNVSGIITGVAPDTKLVVYDVFRPEGGWSTDAIAALNNIKLNATTDRADGRHYAAVNMSIGTPNSPNTSMCQSYASPSIQELKKLGIATVISTGNDGFKNAISSPACSQDAIAVGAVYDSNLGRVENTFTSTCVDETTQADQVACFSNSSNLVTLLAPGVNITAGGIGYKGTSQAAPHVAGAIALLRDTDALPDADVDRIKSILVDSGTTVVDSQNGIAKPRLNIFEATNNVLMAKIQPIIEYSLSKTEEQ